jgi:hypothetical protein
MQRNVVITRHDDLWTRQFIEECSRLLKLFHSGALGKVTGHYHYVGVDPPSGGDQRL